MTNPDTEQFKILFINLGYARGISGSLSDHMRFAHRHFYCPPSIQRQSIQKLRHLIDLERPDICCMVEIDQGGLGTSHVNQLNVLKSDPYIFSDIENKYGPKSALRSFAPTAGKSNAFIARRDFKFEKAYFVHGIKKLVYQIQLSENTTLFFAHFSLNKLIRSKQIIEARDLMRGVDGEVIFLGDFNILTGMKEIAPILEDGRFELLNRHDHPTFFFHKMASVLDLCICSKRMSSDISLRILPQSYTDHAALIVER